MKKSILIFVIFFFSKSCYSQIILDSIYGKWQIDSAFLSKEVTKSINTTAEYKNELEFLSKIKNSTLIINKNKTLKFQTKIKLFEINNGIWRYNKKTNLIEVRDNKIKDYTIMAFKINVINNEYFLYVEETFSAKIKRKKN